MVKVRSLVYYNITSIYIYIDPQKSFAAITFIFLIGIVDSINGVTKSKLTIASTRELKQADDGGAGPVWCDSKPSAQ